MWNFSEWVNSDVEKVEIHMSHFAKDHKGQHHSCGICGLPSGVCLPLSLEHQRRQGWCGIPYMTRLTPRTRGKSLTLAFVAAGGAILLAYASTNFTEEWKALLTPAGAELGHSWFITNSDATALFPPWIMCITITLLLLSLLVSLIQYSRTRQKLWKSKVLIMEINGTFRGHASNCWD